jgi:nucleoside-diphosphate-sugar epimerase
VSSSSKPLVIVTGASGFVGTALCKRLEIAGYAVRRALRKNVSPQENDRIVGEIDGDTTWSDALRGVHIVVHLAARTHVIRERKAALGDYRRINVSGADHLMQQAIAHGARRFVFLSSIKVNGEATAGTPFTEADAPHPHDEYARSKLDAENILTRRSCEAGIELVVLRAPLVYGPGVKGNVLRLLNLVARRVPLPLLSIENRRSLIGLTNLVDAMVLCSRAPEAAGRTYLVSDGLDFSTPTLISSIAEGLSVSPRLFRCPVSLLKLAGALAGRQHDIATLTSSLTVDSGLIRRELGWSPPREPVDEFAEMGHWYNSLICSSAAAQ